MQQNLIPRYETAPGLEAIYVVQRELVAYVEINTMSLWDSREALKAFLETRPFDHSASEFMGIEFEPHVYAVLTARQLRDLQQGQIEPR